MRSRLSDALDFGINNAGIEGEFAPIVDFAEATWDRVVSVNLKGTFLCMKYEARVMLKGGRGGAIVNVGSVNSFLGFAGGPPMRPRSMARWGSPPAPPPSWHPRGSESTSSVPA